MNTRDDVLARISVVVRHGTHPRTEKAEDIAEIIRAAGHYRWVGIYEVSSNEIGVVVWTDPDAPAYPRFPATHGLCGAAVRSRAPVVVGDVTQNARYLTTFGSTRSEIVVPVTSAVGTVLGLIDVESDRLQAFTDADCAFLQQCASVLLPL